MSEFWFVMATFYVISVVLVFGGALIAWVDAKDRWSAKTVAVANARIMLLSPIWPVAGLCYLIYQAYLLFPDLIKDIKGK